MTFPQGEPGDRRGDLYRVFKHRFPPFPGLMLPIEVEYDHQLGTGEQLALLDQQAAKPGGGTPVDMARTVAALIVAQPEERFVAALDCHGPRAQHRGERSFQPFQPADRKSGGVDQKLGFGARQF